MPSKRKRIGYLPSVNIQEMITKIANKEKLSQSKVVGILVEEALKARGLFNLQNRNDLIRKNRYSMEINTSSSSLNYNDLDELISDKGLVYNKEKYTLNKDSPSSKNLETYNEDLFELFQQFILFQKKMKEK